jgi:hypothetical protein
MKDFLKEMNSLIGQVSNISPIIKDQTKSLIKAEMNRELKTLFRRIQVPLPQERNMSEVVDVMTNGDVDVNTLYSRLDTLVVDGLTSPEFISALNIVKDWF